MLPEQGTLEEQERLKGQLARLRVVGILRFVGLAVVALIGTASQITDYAVFELDRGWLVLPPALVYSLIFWFWLRHVRQAQWSASRVARSLRWQAYLQALCDIVALTVLVHLNGGVECPMVYIPLVAVILDGLVLPPAGAFIQANLGAALFALIVVGEYMDWLPHIDYLQEEYRFELYREIPVVMSMIFSITLTLNLVALLISVLGRQLNRAEQQNRLLLGRLRRQVGDAAGQLAQSSGEMRHGAEEVNLVAEQIALTIQEIAQGSGEQATQIEQLSRSLEHLESAGRRMAEGTQETHQASEDAVATTDRGRQAAREATARMQDIAQVFAQAEEALLDLAQRSEQISEIALAIDRFAERTDLLALNAGIEAARAGEHGRGFAIVAGEVKKLAASSSASAEQVATMVAQVQDEIANVVSSVQAGRQRVHDGQEAIDTLGEVLDGMAAVIARAAELAGTMEHLSHQQQQSYQEIVRAVGNLASTAEETAAGAEETAAAVEEQVTSFADLSSAVKDVAALAGRLDQAVVSLYEGDEEKT